MRISHQYSIEERVFVSSYLFSCMQMHARVYVHANEHITV